MLSHEVSGEHSHSEGSRTPEAMGTSDQHLQTHLAGPTPGSAHVRHPKEKASSMKTLNTGALAHQKTGVKTGAVMQGTSSASISSPNENELGQEQQQQHSQKSHNPSQKVGEFPQNSSSQLHLAEGRREVCKAAPARICLPCRGQGRDTYMPSPPCLMSWAPALTVVRNSTILVFKLSIFIIKIITSLVKVQMLQHGVKTPLE